MLLESGLVALGLLPAGWLAWEARRRNVDRWLWSYWRDRGRRRAPAPDAPIDVLICLADHYEPKYHCPTAAQAAARVRRWVEDYPRRFARFRDSDGRPPRHSFFYPVEEYEPAYLDALAGLCADGFGEVEVHLHHDGDTADNLRRTLVEFRDTLAHRHGLLARRGDGGVAYGFIHGNWALCNSRPDGACCGVNEELVVLRETGCYADFTLPAAPSAAQTRTINRIYYAVDRPGQPRSHDTGVEAGTAPAPAGGLMLIQGPLVLDWGHRKWGLLPRLESGVVQYNRPASLDRLPLWLRANVHVPARPDWYFVKLYAHGAYERDHEALLGAPMVCFHEGLAERAARQPNFRYHYVSAREMYNLARAAEAGWKGCVAEALDHELAPGPRLRPSATPAMAAP